MTKDGQHKRERGVKRRRDGWGTIGEGTSVLHSVPPLGSTVFIQNGRALTGRNQYGTWGDL